MPDIKSALSKALEEWSNEETQEKQMDSRSNLPQTFKTTNNITRMTFDYVRDNPGVTAKQAGDYIKSKGLKPHSAIAMMSASVGCGIMRREGNRYYTTVPEYMPLKKRKITTTTPVKKPENKGIKALLDKPTSMPLYTLPTKQELTNEYILSKIGVKQALSLYMELIDIFTGKHYERK
jgi:hypothetical protein